MFSNAASRPRSRQHRPRGDRPLLQSLLAANGLQLANERPASPTCRRAVSVADVNVGRRVRTTRHLGTFKTPTPSFFCPPPIGGADPAAPAQAGPMHLISEERSSIGTLEP